MLKILQHILFQEMFEESLIVHCVSLNFFALKYTYYTDDFDGFVHVVRENFRNGTTMLDM